MVLIAFIGGLGPWEIGIIVLLIVVLFGADKIPRLARSAGEAKKEFEKAKMEAEREIRDVQRDIEEEVQETKESMDVDAEEPGVEDESEETEAASS